MVRSCSSDKPFFAVRLRWPIAGLLHRPCRATTTVAPYPAGGELPMTRAQFAQTDEQRAMQEMARRFATDRLAPGYQQRDKAGTLDKGLIREMGALGLIGVDLAE